MIDITKDLPEWARKRGHPIPLHKYLVDEDSGMIVMTCPNEAHDFRLHHQACPHEPKEKKPT